MKVAADTTWADAVRWARPHIALLAATLTLQSEPMRRCDCGAAWNGTPNDECPWCQAATERHRQDRRHNLLWPDWMLEQGPRYDQLTDIDKAVWDATRGIQRGQDSITMWAQRLIDAIADGTITQQEAELATARAERQTQ